MMRLKWQLTEASDVGTNFTLQADSVSVVSHCTLGCQMKGIIWVALPHLRA